MSTSIYKLLTGLIFTLGSFTSAATNGYQGQFKLKDGPKACADRVAARVEGKRLSINELAGNKIDLQGQCANSMSREKHESFGIQENPKGTLSGASLTVESNCPGSREKWVYDLTLDRKRKKNELRYEFTSGTELINCRYQETK